MSTFYHFLMSDPVGAVISVIIICVVVWALLNLTNRADDEKGCT
jgi:hypothetical protein